MTQDVFGDVPIAPFCGRGPSRTIGIAGVRMGAGARAPLSESGSTRRR